MESDKKKLFVRSLSRKTTDDSLREHFGKYGIVESSYVCCDGETGNAKGYGFVSFEDSSSAKDALQDTHIIDGKKVEVYEANSEGEGHTQHQMKLNNNSDGSGNDSFRNKKIFVGGLAPTVTKEELRNFFEEFGMIIDAVVIHDKVTNLSRGFGFITFDSEQSFEKALQSRFYDLGGKVVEVKRAVPRDRNNNTNLGFVPKVWNGSWSPFNDYQHGIYQQYGYGVDLPPHFAPIYWYRGCGEYLNSIDGYGGWPVGAYGGMVYRVPYSTHLPWNGTCRVGARGCTLPNGTSYPSHVNGKVGVMAMDETQAGTSGVQLNESDNMDEILGSDAVSDKQEDQSNLEGQFNGKLTSPMSALL